MEITILVWIALGALTYSMAEKRKRNGIAWAVLSVLSIPIAGPIILLAIGEAKTKEESND